MPSPFDATTWNAGNPDGYAPPEGGAPALNYADPVRAAQVQEGHAPVREVGDLLREQAQRYEYEQEVRRQAQSGAYINPDATGQRRELRHEAQAEGPCDECMADLRKANVIGIVTGFVIGAGLLGALYFATKGRTTDADYEPAE